MHWSHLTDIEQINSIKQESFTQKIVIFKHSTRCSISRTVLDRLQRNWSTDEMKSMKPYYLDLLSYRDISNLIADEFGVTHQSPQVIVIENGRPIFHTSHLDISYQRLKELS
ncbi:MAG TPA: bacillithiol system redox-active protein YtxJ [Cytophagales bacterium]|jgi:bacillithiol system protein YtxJ|nr:bacillithiol system redox-active protein YtxJ [Cytophagales bacterium]